MKTEKHQTLKLTQKQELFALEYILNGRNATAAYEEVYNTKTENKNTLWVNAHKVLKNDKVSLRIHQLEMQQFDSHILTIEERKKILTTESKQGNIKAIDMLNRMDGIYIDKQELTHQGNLSVYTPAKKEDN